jgi:hypothetical protein
MDMPAMMLAEADARRADDHVTANRWRECIEVARFHAQLDEWDVLKGSPEHDGRVHD